MELEYERRVGEGRGEEYEKMLKKLL